MFEKAAEEYVSIQTWIYESAREDAKHHFQEGAEFGYNKQNEEIRIMKETHRQSLKILTDQIEELHKTNEWHKVSDKLPEMDVFIYLWNNVNDFPVVACRHIPHGKKEWVWDCKWGSGFTVSQSVGKDYFWKEIVLPELKESSK